MYFYVFFLLRLVSRICFFYSSEPSSSHLGLGLGLGVTFFLLLVVIALALVHRKFGLFSGMCDNFPPLRIFGIRGQEISMDNEDDVTPIVWEAVFPFEVEMSVH